MPKPQRFFVNELIDYQSEDAEDDNLIDPNTSPLIRGSAAILDSASKLLIFLETKLVKDVDYKDNSVYTGISGYAYLYLYLSKTGYQREKNLEKAAELSSQALKQLRGRDVTFLCGDAGPLTVSILIANEKKNVSEMNKLISQLLQRQKTVIELDSSLPDEILYGRSGYLYSLLLLRKEVPSSQNLITDQHIRQVVTAILMSGQRSASGRQGLPPLAYFWHDCAYSGAAHGYAGILYQLLNCEWLLTDQERDTLIRPTIDFLSAIRSKSGNTPSSIGRTSDELVHWCHGAPGMVSLFTKSYQVFKDPKYLAAASESCEVIWERGLLIKGYGLCHGAAGNGYAFLNLFKATKDMKHLHRAIKFAEWCTEYEQHETRTPDRPWSLFEGLAGTVYFLFDLAKPDSALFPAYEL